MQREYTIFSKTFSVKVLDPNVEEDFDIIDEVYKTGQEHEFTENTKSQTALGVMKKILHHVAGIDLTGQPIGMRESKLALLVIENNITPIIEKELVVQKKKRTR
jgi:hypothetical protein